MKLFVLFLALILHHSSDGFPSVPSNPDNKQVPDKDSTKKIIGSSVVTSVSVILNGEKPEFTDAVGHRLPKPQEPLQVASPINLLNPDRYEFYTFDNNGQLVKRIMTLKEIHSIVANGDGEGATVIHNSPINDRDPEKNVQDIVTSVQNVLHKEVEWKNNASNPNYQMLDTPDVSSSWSMILPAIFGNTGGDIFPHSRPQQVVMTPDSDVVESVTKPTTKRKTQKPKLPPKRRPTTTTTTTTLPILSDEDENNSPQKIFMNNEEIIKPLFNRNDVKVETPTTVKESATTFKVEIVPPTKSAATTTMGTTKRTRPLKPRPSKQPILEVTTKRDHPEKYTTTTSIPASPSSTSKRTTIQQQTRKPTTSSTASPTTTTTTKRVHNLQKVRPTTTTAPAIPLTSTTRIPTFAPSMSTPLTTKRTQIKRKYNTTATPPVASENSTLEKVQIVKHKKKPTQTTLSPSSSSSTSSFKKNPNPTKRKPTISSSATPRPDNLSTISTQLPPRIESSTKLPMTSSTTTTTDQINTEENVSQISEIKIENSSAEPELDMISLSSIVSSLTQNQEDLNTKMSFDQIIESLKDKTDDIPATTETMKLSASSSSSSSQSPPTAQPVLYNNANILKPKDKIPFQTTIKHPQLSSTTAAAADISDSFETTEITTILPDTESNDSSSVVKFEPLFAELLDPILTQLTTEMPITTTDSPPSTEIIPTSESESLIVTEEGEDADIDAGTINSKTELMLNETLIPTTEMTNIDKTTSSEASQASEPSEEQNGSSSSEIAQRIDDFIANNMQNNEMVAVVEQQPIIQPLSSSNTNFDMLNQQSNMDMKDIQNEAATLASMLMDNLMPQTTINPNKPVILEQSNEDEIQALVSDVLSQITDAAVPQSVTVAGLPASKLSETSKLPNFTTDSIKTLEEEEEEEKSDEEESSNRFTNLAQISPSIFLPPAKEITASELNSNDKFHMLETLALQLNATNQEKNNQTNSINDKIQKIHTENSKNQIELEQQNNHDDSVVSSNLAAIENQAIIKKTTSVPLLGMLTSAPVATNFDASSSSTEKILEQELLDNENVSKQTEDDNEDSTTSKEIQSMIETTAMSLFETAPAQDQNASSILNQTTQIPLLLVSKISTNINADAVPPPTTEEYIETEDENSTESNSNKISTIQNEKYQGTEEELSTFSSSSEKYDDFGNNGMMSAATTEGNDATSSSNSTDTTEIFSNETTEEADKLNDDANQSSESSSLESTTSKSSMEKYDEQSDSDKSTESTEENRISSSTVVAQASSDESTELSSSDETTEPSSEKLQFINKLNFGTEPTPTTNIFNLTTEGETETEDLYVKLGESNKKHQPTRTSGSAVLPAADSATIKLTIIPPRPTSAQLSPLSKRKPTLKPVHYFKQPTSQSDHKLIAFNGQQLQRPVVRPAALTNLKVTQISTATRSPVKLEPSPTQSLGLEASTMDLQEDIQEFARLCNELAFNYWRSITAEKISNARSLVLCPFALTSMLSMVFLGARGGTSGEMNEILRLDDMVTFNPHLVFKNITESVEQAVDSDIASSAFVREIFSDRSNGKILPFFKEKTQQLYSGHVEEVNFNVVNDIIRRRTNLLVKRHTKGKVAEYLRTNSVWVNGPLSTVSANLFQTDCSRGSMVERDGEMFFQVHPSIRQRRLVPIPAVVWRTGFTAGYDPELDATAVAFGSTEETVSTIYVMPGQHGLAAPGDNLERLERNIMENGISKNSWSHLLTSLMQRPGLEVQLPRFSHRSFVNASVGLQKLGLKALFDSDNADLRGLTGSSNKDVYLSDMIQINTFSTCGEEKINEHHHVEMYPAPPLRKRNSDIGENDNDFMNLEQMDFGGSIGGQDSARGFYDDLLDPKYLELPLPLRPRQARIPDAPRLRFDKPFLYFVRHNPTGMILFMGRFNPRLLP